MKVALVTGAASGIGRATAALLRAQGWWVAGLDRDPIPAGAVDHTSTVDLRDDNGIVQAVDAAAATHGRLDALVCAAGISGSSAGDGPIGSGSAAAFDTLVAVNLRGAFLVADAAWSALAVRGGSVVTVSSVLGLTGGGGPFRSHAYIVTKAGLVGLTRALAAQGRAVGIRSNCVAPGLVDTPLAVRATTNPVVGAYVADRQPLTGGPIAAADVAAAIAYLCSDAARAITGQTLAIDAGWHLDPS